MMGRDPEMDLRRQLGLRGNIPAMRWWLPSPCYHKIPFSFFSVPDHPAGFKGSPSLCVLSLFMSPEINLVIWIDSCVPRDYKTWVVDLLWAVILSCVSLKMDLRVAIVAATAQGCWLLQPGFFFFFTKSWKLLRSLVFFCYTLCWLELFPNGWNHNQFVFPQAGELLQDVGDYVSKGETWNEIRENTEVPFSWADVDPGMTHHPIYIALYLSHNCARCFWCL